MNLARRILAATLAAYAGLVLIITLSPRMPGTSSIAVLVNSVLASLHAQRLLLGVRYDHIEFMANIAMFVPLGVLAALVVPRRTWWVLPIAGPTFSGLIELYQSLLLPGRVGEWRDVLSNSLGFILGVVVVALARIARRAVERRPNRLS